MSRPELKRVTIAGDFRRGCELVGDLAIVAEAAKPDETSMPSADGLQIRVSDPKHFGAALLFATGSAGHIEQLQALAAEKGMRLDSDGLHKGRTLIAGEEADIYRALGLPFIDPELREGRGEIEAALKRKLPKLVTDQDLRGILHCHTDASDGTRRWRPWPRPRASGASSISAWPTIQSLPTMPGVSPLTRSRSSTGTPID